MGIRSKLLLCLLSVLIPVMVASAFTAYMINLNFSARVKAELVNTRRLEAARINEQLDGYREHVESLAHGMHVRTFMADIDAWRRGQLPANRTIGGVDNFSLIDPAADWPLQQLALALQRKGGLIGSEIVELRMIDRGGRVLGETLGFEWTPVDPSLPSTSMSEGRVLFGEAFTTMDSFQRLGMVAPIYSLQGQVVGALMVETRLGPIVNLVAQHEGLSESSEAHIAQPTIDGDAQFITALRFSRDAAFNKIVPRERNLPINRSLVSPEGAVVQSEDYRGEPSILAIETLDATGWGLVVKMDQAEAFAPLRQFLAIVFMAALTTVALVIAGYFFCLHPIARRLQRTALAARRIMDGDLESRINDQVPDEIGHMASSIDRLASDLQADQRQRTLIEERLRHQAMHDDLTGLFNRQHANSLIRKLSQDSSTFATVMFLDLDGFKSINDLFGHAAGDAVLIAIARRLQSLMTGEATLARWGGDEFVIILPNTSGSQAVDVASRVHAVFDDPIATDFGTHQIGCSIGLASSSADQSLDDAIIEADTLMYEQKKRRYGTRHLPGGVPHVLSNALRDERVEVWYQPIVDTTELRADGSAGHQALVGAEALVRVRSRDGGVIPPAEFADEIEARKLGTELDNRVMTLALEALARWRAAGLVSRSFCLSINITGQSLSDDTLIARLGKHLCRLALPPDCVVIEISESADRLDDALIRRLRNLGVQIALDDVGINHSNLDRLVGVRPDVAKLDRRWLADDTVLPRLTGLCQALVNQVVAEGIETREQSERLISLGVTRQQGFLFSRPTRALPFLDHWGIEANLCLLGEASQTTGKSLALAV